MPGQGVRTWVRQHLAELLGVDPASVSLDRSLYDLGLDSVDGVILAGELEEAYGIEIDPAAFLRHPTLEIMVGALEAQLG